MIGRPSNKTAHGQRRTSWNGSKDGDESDGCIVLKLGSYRKFGAGCEVANRWTPRVSTPESGARSTSKAPQYTRNFCGGTSDTPQARPSSMVGTRCGASATA